MLSGARQSRPAAPGGRAAGELLAPANLLRQPKRSGRDVTDFQFMISRNSAMIRPVPIPSGSVLYKVFVRGDDGQWRIASSHSSRCEAEAAADLLTREGVVARVML